MTWLVAATYLKKVPLGFGEARTHGLAMSSFSSSSTFYISSIQQKEPDFFHSLYKGSPCSPNRDMKQLRATRHPMSYYMSLTFLT
jgi:hypothetical protein